MYSNNLLLFAQQATPKIAKISLDLLNTMENNVRKLKTCHQQAQISLAECKSVVETVKNQKKMCQRLLQDIGTSVNEAQTFLDKATLSIQSAKNDKRVDLSQKSFLQDLLGTVNRRMGTVMSLHKEVHIPCDTALPIDEKLSDIQKLHSCMKQEVGAVSNGCDMICEKYKNICNESTEAASNVLDLVNKGNDMASQMKNSMEELQQTKEKKETEYCLHIHVEEWQYPYIIKISQRLLREWRDCFENIFHGL